MRSLSYILLLCGLCLTSEGVAQDKRVEQLVQEFVSNDALKGASVGVCIKDLKTDKYLAQHDAGRRLVPASTLKVLTTAAALDKLGADYRFETNFYLSGEMVADVWQGNVYILGSSDPTLASDFFDGPGLDRAYDDVVGTLWQLGIKEISGGIIAVSGALDGVETARDWQWQDLGNYYGANAWQVNIADNKYIITFKQKSVKGEIPPIVKIEPNVPNLKLSNLVKTGPVGSGDNAYIFGVPYQNERFVTGTIPAGSGLFSINGSIPNPPLFAAQHLKSSIEQKGIKVSGNSSVETPADLPKASKDWQHIYTITSPPLRDIIKIINKRSNNVYAESVYYALRAKQDSDQSSPVSDWLNTLGMDDTHVSERDGSGMSRKNLCTAMAMTDVLSQIYRKTYFSDFMSSLARPGEEGTLKRAFLKMPGQTELYAKSGSLSGVIAYTGYIVDGDKDIIAFTVLINHYDGSFSVVRNHIEQLVYAISRVRR